MAGFMALLALLGASTDLPAQDHVVWVDFATCSFDITAFDFVRTPARRLADGTVVPASRPRFTSADLEVVKALILRDMARDFANYDVQLTTFRPAAGRYTWVQVGGRRADSTQTCSSTGTLLGTSLPRRVLAATGHASWRTEAVSRSFMYSDRLSDSPPYDSIFMGAGTLPDSLARIANAVAYIASHETGHVLGLEHWYAADSNEPGFANPSAGSSPHRDHGSISPPAASGTDTPGAYSHVMATKGSHQPNMERRLYGTNAFRFSPRISNEHLIQNLGVRAYHLPLATTARPGAHGQLGGILAGEIQSATGVAWSLAPSTASSFDWRRATGWTSDAGDATDIFLTGDVDGDGTTDLLFGRPQSSTTVTWYAARSDGRGFRGSVTLANDAGDVGDVFRIGDVDGDGMADLLYGRPQSTADPDAIPLSWFVRTSTGGGSSLATERQWLAHGGYQGHPLFVGDFDGDGRDDLIASRIVDDETVRWSFHRSTGSGFAAPVRISVDAGDRGDRFLMGDVNADGLIDLVYGQRISRTQIRWYVRLSSGSQLAQSPSIWNDSAGESGDVVRLGDMTGDGRADLVFVRRDSPILPRWYVSISDGASFASLVPWAIDFGKDGDLTFVTRPVPPRDPVVDSVRNGPPLRNAGRVRVRVYFAGPTDADSIEVVTPRSDGMVVWATPRTGRFGGVWEAAWAQDRPPGEGCIAHARAWLGAWSSNHVPVDWCPYVASAAAAGASGSSPSPGTPGNPPAAPAIPPQVPAAAAPPNAMPPPIPSAAPPPALSESACWVRTTWAGGRISGTEDVFGTTPPGSPPQYITGSLYGSVHFVQGAQAVVTIRLQQRLRNVVPGTYTPESMWMAVDAGTYGLQAGWALGDRFNPGPAQVVIRSVTDGIVEGTASAAMYNEIFSTTPFDPNDAGPSVVNVTVDFRYPLGPSGLADCPTDP